MFGENRTLRVVLRSYCRGFFCQHGTRPSGLNLVCHLRDSPDILVLDYIPKPILSAKAHRLRPRTSFAVEALCLGGVDAGMFESFREILGIVISSSAEGSPEGSDPFSKSVRYRVWGMTYE